MKRLTLSSLLLATGLTLSVTGCGDKNKGNGDFPADFNSIGDAGRVNILIRTLPADSVARFIINASLGKVPGARIDTLAIATNAAYERLKGAELEKFSTAYENIIATLPLAEKMKVYANAGADDPQGLGYRLGLEYLTSIRDEGMTIKDVERELAELEKACGQDTATFRRFMIGFRTVLRVDSGKDVPADIYNRYAK